MTDATPMLTTDTEMHEACGRWSGEPAIAVDTEFVRTRTYYARLGLLQVAGGRGPLLLDPLGMQDVVPLRDLMSSPGVTKVFHSCGEDLEVLNRWLGVLPSPIWDTQIAAAFLGHGVGKGYAALLKDMLGVELGKHQTRTNWLKRPLSPEQVAYAAEDVEHLLEIHALQRAALQESGRLAWAEEECESLRRAGRYAAAPESAYRRIRSAWQLKPHNLAVLQGLCAWRERHAQRRDLPRHFIAEDKVLTSIARHPPANLEALGEVKGIAQGLVRRHGERILKVVEAALALPAEACPAPLPRPLHSPRMLQVADAARRDLAEIGAETGVPPELVATRQAVEDLVRRVVQDGAREATDGFQGWRRTLLGRDAVEWILDVAQRESGKKAAAAAG